ncbi:MAG: DMT family transporter [Sphingomonadales bacterium]|nr:DMT family transporter [Sphingomonadales bacterium]MBD3772947.1 DMT family transporter [Paracoccaceae bacterium]MBD3813979.1 DMT family transporter [Betaproteobacteria bacterium]
MQRHPAFMPIVVTLLGIAMLSLMDAFMKGASLAIGAYSAAWLRAAIGLAVIAPAWLVAGGRWPTRKVLRLHLLRGVVSTFMALTFFIALTKLPLAETIAISFVAPIVSLFLAALLLGEQVRRRAITGSVLGLAGTLVIIGGRLGSGRLDDDALLGLGSIVLSALLYAWNLVLQRQQALVAKPAEVATFHCGVATLVLGLAAPFMLVLPDLPTLGHLGIAALLTVGGAMVMSWAYARAEAQLLVPFEYSAFLWATLFGWLFFAEEIRLPTLAGTALIVIGCWIASRKPTEQSAI